jgi:hypothetical protein
MIPSLRFFSQKILSTITSISVLSLLTITSSYSASENKLSEIETELPKTQTTNANSSMNRENKTYSLLVGMGGEATTFAGHFAIDYFLKKDLVLQLKGVRDTGSQYNPNAEREQENSINLGLKVFEGNSFYFKPSIGYLEFSHYDTITILFDGLTNSYSEPDQLFAITGSLSIGNQWQWSHFTLGVEWVGITQTLATLDYDNDPNKTFLTALQLSLGASF